MYNVHFVGWKTANPTYLYFPGNTTGLLSDIGVKVETTISLSKRPANSASRHNVMRERLIIRPEYFLAKVSLAFMYSVVGDTAYCIKTEKITTMVVF